MRPIPIPPDLMIPKFRKVQVGAPEDTPWVQPIEALWLPESQRGPGDPPIYMILLEFDQQDLIPIADKHMIWMAQVTDSMVPFSFTHLDQIAYRPVRDSNG